MWPSRANSRMTMPEVVPSKALLKLLHVRQAMGLAVLEEVPDLLNGPPLAIAATPTIGALITALWAETLAAGRPDPQLPDQRWHTLQTCIPDHAMGQWLDRELTAQIRRIILDGRPTSKPEMQISQPTLQSAMANGLSMVMLLPLTSDYANWSADTKVLVLAEMSRTNPHTYTNQLAAIGNRH